MVAGDETTGVAGAGDGPLDELTEVGPTATVCGVVIVSEPVEESLTPAVALLLT